MRIDPEAKRLALERAGGLCERCGKPGNVLNWELHVHHITYERQGHEEVGDLEVICLDCHGKEHPRHRFETRTVQGQIHARRCRGIKCPHCHWPMPDRKTLTRHLKYDHPERRKSRP